MRRSEPYNTIYSCSAKGHSCFWKTSEFWRGTTGATSSPSLKERSRFGARIPPASSSYRRLQPPIRWRVFARSLLLVTNARPKRHAHDVRCTLYSEDDDIYNKFDQRERRRSPCSRFSICIQPQRGYSMPLQESTDPAAPSWAHAVTADFLIFYSSRDEDGRLWCPVRGCVRVTLRADRNPLSLPCTPPGLRCRRESRPEHVRARRGPIGRDCLRWPAPGVSAPPRTTL